MANDIKLNKIVKKLNNLDQISYYELRKELSDEVNNNFNQISPRCRIAIWRELLFFSSFKEELKNKSKMLYLKQKYTNQHNKKIASHEIQIKKDLVRLQCNGISQLLIKKSIEHLRLILIELSNSISFIGYVQGLDQICLLVFLTLAAHYHDVQLEELQEEQINEKLTESISQDCIEIVSCFILKIPEIFTFNTRGILKINDIVWNILNKCMRKSSEDHVLASVFHFLNCNKICLQPIIAKYSVTLFSRDTCYRNFVKFIDIFITETEPVNYIAFVCSGLIVNSCYKLIKNNSPGVSKKQKIIYSQQKN